MCQSKQSSSQRQVHSPHPWLQPLGLPHYAFQSSIILQVASPVTTKLCQHATGLNTLWTLEREVPEAAGMCCSANSAFLQVIPCPNGKNSSHGSSEQTGTQRTDPSAEYVPPSTRTATGSLPSRSRSSYSWGSDGQAPGPQGPDKLTRTSSTAANARAAQPTPQVRASEFLHLAFCNRHMPVAVPLTSMQAKKSLVAAPALAGYCMQAGKVPSCCAVLYPACSCAV